MCLSVCVCVFSCIVSCFTRWLGHANLSLNTKLAGHAGSFILGEKNQKKQRRINKQKATRSIYCEEQILTAGPL